MSAPAARAFRFGLALAGAALVLAGGACAHRGAGRGSGNPFSQSPAGGDKIQIHVLNMNFNDATVWALVRDTRHERLGIVTGKSEATFTMAWAFPDVLSIEFDLIGGVRCVTEGLSVDPGEILELQISLDPSQDPGCR